MVTRRKFISYSAGLGMTAALNPLKWPGKNPTENNASLKILILGGTSFLGPHQIAYALDRGHQVTTFTRGKTRPTIYSDIFDQVESLIGDRENNLEALKGRQWDVVIDNSGHRVHWTQKTAELLKDEVGLYVYTSSTGVFYPYLDSDIHEDHPVVLAKPENLNEEQDMEYSYGVMKANSELRVREIFGKERSIIIRPTYMMGPGDRSDRFTYWPIRLAQGGEVIVPGKPDDPVQYIDVRDVAEWMIRLIEDSNVGTYNTVGPPSTTGMLAFVYGVHAAFSSSCEFVHIDDYEFLKAHDVRWAIPWILPEGENFGSARINFAKALENGLTYRPLATSCQDIFKWWNSGVVPEERKKELLHGKGSLYSKRKLLLEGWRK